MFSLPLNHWKVFPVVLAAQAELHEAETIHEKVAAKMVCPARVRCAKAVAMKAVPVRARFWTEPIRATVAAKKAVQPDAMAADRTGAEFHCAKAVRSAEAFRCVTDDLHRGSLRGLASNAAYQQNRATDCCARFPANSALGQESGQQFCIRFHAVGGQGEQSVHPEFCLAKQNSRLRCEWERSDSATQPPDHHESEPRRLPYLERQCDPDRAPSGVQSPEIPTDEQFQFVRLSTRALAQPAQV